MNNFAVEIEIPDQLWLLLQYCQVCSVECCGVDAFDMNHSLIQGWLAAVTERKLRILSGELYSLEKYFSTLTTEYEISCAQLNFVGSPSEWLQLIQQWRSILESSHGFLH